MNNLAVKLTCAVILTSGLISASAFGFAGGTGTAYSPYQIATQADLEAVNDNLSANYILVKDIYLADTTYTTAVIAPNTDTSSSFHGTPFTGKLDGNGHIISGLTIDTAGADNSYLGLFGKVSSTGTISNLGLKNVSITGGDGSRYLGGLCGYNDSGTITNCYAAGAVTGDRILGGLCGGNNHGTITNCYAAGSVTGGDASIYLGGLCGYNDSGNITDCYAAGAVTGGNESEYLGGLCGYIAYSATSTNCYATGAVTGGDNSEYLGGLCGYNDSANITNCYATGAVTGDGALGGLCGWNYRGIITNCYAMGATTGVDYIGGLCGKNGAGTITNCYATGAVTGGASSEHLGGLCGDNSDTITNCFWDTETSGISTSSGGTGKTTAQMQSQSTFEAAGWDFIEESVNGTDDIWWMPCLSYPRLMESDVVAGDFFTAPIAASVDTLYHGSTTRATGNDITEEGLNDCIDVWYRFRPSAAGNYDISLCGSSFDTTLAVFYYDKKEIAFNDDYCGYRSLLTISKADPATDYYIRISGYNGERGDYALLITAAGIDIAGDLNNDGIVDFNDLAILASNWLVTG